MCIADCLNYNTYLYPAILVAHYVGQGWGIALFHHQ